MMRIKTTVAASLVACLMLAACSINESFVDGFDQDPNLPTDAPTEKVFIAGQVGAIVFHEGYAARIANMWSQHFVTDENQYLTIYNYGVTAQDFDPIWSVAYVRALANLRVAQAKAAADGGKENLVAVAQINEALLMGTVAALFGDVPYREAADDQINDPVFESQLRVYEQVLALLDDAIEELAGSPRNLSGGVDIYSFAGRAGRWVKAAYTLKARFHMHMSGVDPSNLQRVIDATSLGIDEAGGRGDLRILHGTVVNEDVNLWSAFTSDRAWLFAEGGHALTLLNQRNNSKTDESGRISQLFVAGLKFPNITRGAFKPDSPFPLVTYVENQLLRAEAFARLGNDADALEALNRARAANKTVYGGPYDALSMQDFATGEYAGKTLLQEILDETYLAYIASIEAFNFVRRVDYPITPVTGSRIPQRFLYANTEINANSNAPQPIPALMDPTPVNQ